jgi:natural product precursor
MDNKPKLKKLKLSKEMIRTLQETELSMVVGGSDSGCDGNTEHTSGCWSWECGSAPRHAPLCKQSGPL